MNNNKTTLLLWTPSLQWIDRLRGVGHCNISSHSNSCRPEAHGRGGHAGYTRAMQSTIPEDMISPSDLFDDSGREFRSKGTPKLVNAQQKVISYDLVSPSLSSHVVDIRTVVLSWFGYKVAQDSEIVHVLKQNDGRRSSPSSAHSVSGVLAGEF